MRERKKGREEGKHGVREGGKERGHALPSCPTNGLNCQGYARPEPGARNSILVFHKDIRDPRTWEAAFPSALAGSWVVSAATRTQANAVLRDAGTAVVASHTAPKHQPEHLLTTSYSTTDFHPHSVLGDQRLVPILQY